MARFVLICSAIDSVSSIKIFSTLCDVPKQAPSHDEYNLVIFCAIHLSGKWQPY